MPLVQVSLTSSHYQRPYLTVHRQHRIYLYCRGCQLYVNPAIHLNTRLELYISSSDTYEDWRYKNTKLTYTGRHGDIEDALLAIVMARAAGGKKFDKMNVARVYFVSAITLQDSFNH